jgi:tetratricopeptide (TPR) repeat protein
VAIVAKAGLGRSRMLASCVLEAKLIGAAVVSIDASAVGAEFGMAGALAEGLLEVVPVSAADVLDVAGVLGHVSPALHKTLGEPELAELKPFERVRRVSAAVVALVLAVSRRQPLVIAVDDVHRTDGASLGALGSIAKLAAEDRVLLVTSCDESALRDAPPVLQALLLPEQRIELAPLRAEDTRELLGSLFGATSGLDEAAAWLHDLSRGSPQACMQYAQYLVDHGLARYEGGQWRLPPHLREQALPATLGAMLESRLAELSADARALALGLALARDETRSIWQPENHVRIEDYPKLLAPADSSAGAKAAGGDAARAFLALDELLRADLVQQRDAHYVLAQGAMIEALLRVSDDAAQAVMHERLAQILDQPAYQGRMLPVRQLQRAGQHARARALLTNFTTAMSAEGASMNWGAMRVSLSAQCSRIALADWEREGGSVLEGIILRRLVAITSAVYDWSGAQVGDAQVAQLRADCGLVYWDETDPALAPLERVVACLTRAQQRYDSTPEAERGLSPGDAVRELASCLMTILGAHVHAHDVARVRALPPVLEPLRPLSPLIALICDLQTLGVDRVLGRELGDRIAEFGVHQLFGQAALPEVLRIGGAGVNAHLQAMEDARRGRRRATDIVELLVPYAGEDMYLVIHARWLGHAFRGQSELAESFRKRVDLATEDDVWRRKATLYIEAELHALTGDLPALHRTCEAIAELAQAFPGWRPWHAWARGAAHRLRGEYEAAQSQLDLALASAPPGEHRAWLRIAPARAELLLLRGDAEDALAEAEAMITSVRALALDLTAEVAAERVRALAHSRLARHEAARAALQSMFALARKIGYDGLPLALLHEAHARVAIAAGRTEEAAIALGALHGLLEHAHAPALINAYEMMRAEISELALPELGAPRDPARSQHSDFAQLSTVATQVHERMSSLSGRQERARHALQLLLEDAGAQVGHLFVFDAAGLLVLAASSDDGASSAEVLELAQKHVDAELQGSSTDAVTVAADVVTGTTTASATLTASGAQLSPALLHIGERAALSAIALIGGRERAPRPPRTELLQVLSRCLLTAGDTIPLMLAG